MTTSILSLSRALALVTLLLMTSTLAYSQGRVDKYTTETFSGDFNDISRSGNTFELSCWWAWCQGTADISLPFDFNYDKVDLPEGTTLRVASSGVLQFNPQGGPPTDYALSSNRYPGMLCFYNGYIGIGDGNNGDNTQYYEVSGDAPNRVLTIQIHRIHQLGSGEGRGNGGIQTSVQIKLYETTNVIEVLYLDHAQDMGRYESSPSPGVGLNGFSFDGFTSLEYQSATSTPKYDLRFTPPPPPAQLSLQPKNLDFGNTPAGSPRILCTTVSSVGENPLTITGAGLGGAPDYEIVSGPSVGTVLQPGETADYCIRFAPLAAGTRTATLTVTTDGADSGTQRVSLTGRTIAPGLTAPVTASFRKVRVLLGDSTTIAIPIQSSGTSPLSITGFQISGLNPNDYYVSKYPTAPIPVGAWDSIYIVFKPSLEGRPDETITVLTNALNMPQFSITLFGQGILPRLVVQPSTLVFDTTFIGTQNCQHITLTNTGSDVLKISKNFLSSSDYDFTLQGLTGSDTLLNPGQSRTVTVCFSPLRLGTRLATMRINTNIPRTMETPSRDTSAFTVQIRGIGMPIGALALAGITDSVIVRQTVCRADTIRNYGTVDVTITRAVLSSLDSADWTFSGLTLPLTIKPGAIAILNFCVTPSAQGPRATTLVLTTTSNGRPQVLNLPLTAYGLQVCASASTVSLFSTSKTLVGMNSMDSVTIQNCGEVPTTYTAAITNGATFYSVNGTSTSPVIQPDGSTTFYVRFTPTSRALAAGTLTVTGGTGVTPITIALNGTGAGVSATATGQPGEVAQGDCKTFDVTITNEGNIDWTPGAAMITGTNAGDFSIVSGPNPLVVAPGGMTVVQVKFCPTTGTTENATLSFGNDAPAANFSYNLTGATSGVSDNAAQAGFLLDQSYPNPVSRGASVHYTVPVTSLVRIDILDQTGKIVSTPINGSVTAGEHTMSITTQDLASGTYYYVLTSGQVRLTRQMTVIK